MLIGEHLHAPRVARRAPRTQAQRTPLDARRAGAHTGGRTATSAARWLPTLPFKATSGPAFTPDEASAETAKAVAWSGPSRGINDHLGGAPFLLVLDASFRRAHTWRAGRLVVLAPVPPEAPRRPIAPGASTFSPAPPKHVDTYSRAS